MSPKMPCSITDGEQYEDRAPGFDDLDDGDALYDQARQDQIDDRVRRIDEPDLRNQDQRDLGIELEWRLRVARRYVLALWGSVITP